MADTTVKETFVPPRSSNIAAATYDPQTQELEIEFHSGDVYTYANVPQGVYSGLTASSSVGSYFYRHIRGNYAYEQQ